MPGISPGRSGASRGRRPLPRGAPRARPLAAGGARRLRNAALLQLRRALAQPRAAVRALRDVRRHLRATVLADDEEVGPARHGLTILRAASGLSATPASRPRSRARPR